jgi:predicted ATPase/DNA-binding winged helix-turn-helix (wHTH) protein
LDPAVNRPGQTGKQSRNSSGTNVLSFGPFTLTPALRRLELEGRQVSLATRSLDILLALVERSGEVVTKTALMQKAWPDASVEEGNLRLHIAALRKSLGDGKDGARYVTTVTGRGYCFVAPVSSEDPTTRTSRSYNALNGPQNLPARLARMAGRAEAVRDLSRHLIAERFVTITGTGGIGKTTVAVAVGHDLLAEFDGFVYFFDLAPLTDPKLVPNALASTLGLIVHSDPIEALIAYLRDRRVLLILDSCEHVIEVVGSLAERLFEEAPSVNILATSREALLVEGEHVHKLAPLAAPPEALGTTATQIADFPAVQLFIERITANGSPFALSDTEFGLVSEICRKLDGIPLAIELVAGNIGSFGIQETAELLRNRLWPHWRGMRTASPRHQTLSATLDWSYDLLDGSERKVLCRVCLLVGSFTLDAARQIAAGNDITADLVMEVLAGLVSKSLVTVSIDGDAPQYRLPDTTRAYGFDKLRSSGELEATAYRHAVYFRDLLEKDAAAAAEQRQGLRVQKKARMLGDVSAALEFAFFDSKDTALATSLAAASSYLFLDLSLLMDCHRWSKKALELMNSAQISSRCEMELQVASALSQMFTIRNDEAVEQALKRALAISEQRGDEIFRFRILNYLHTYYVRSGNFHGSLSFAERAEELSNKIEDVASVALAQSLVGTSKHLLGNQAAAAQYFEAALGRDAGRNHTETLDVAVGARLAIFSARTLWLQGYADRAAEAAREAVIEAIDHPLALCIAYIGAITVHQWIGDFDSAEEEAKKFVAHAARHSLQPYSAAAQGMTAQNLIRRGRLNDGIVMLQRVLNLLHSLRYELLATAFGASLAEGLAIAGQTKPAAETINELIARVEMIGGSSYIIPELYRLRGEILDHSDGGNLAAVEYYYRQSLEQARRQMALGWELRAASSLARHLVNLKRTDEARELLYPIYERFSEGFATADLKNAKRLLEDFEQPGSARRYRVRCNS